LPVVATVPLSTNVEMANEGEKITKAEDTLPERLLKQYLAAGAKNQIIDTTRRWIS